jgi:hypothetical protein
VIGDREHLRGAIRITGPYSELIIFLSEGLRVREGRTDEDDPENRNRKKSSHSKIPPLDLANPRGRVLPLRLRGELLSIALETEVADSTIVRFDTLE